MTTPRVILKPRKALPFFSQHPWVFAGAIASITNSPEDGAEVDLYSEKGEWIARGLFNSQSNIRVRLFSWKEELESLDRAFFESRIRKAVELRNRLPGCCGDGTAYRLIYSEGDGLSGLIVDRYDQWLVVQITSLALGQRLEMITEILQELVEPQGILLRTEKGTRKLEGLEIKDGPLHGTIPDEPVVIRENGIDFRVDLREGQKTGFYLDQRENRKAVAELSHGRRVLDTFCYTGGFALYAARAGAASVMGVDSSEAALAIAAENAALNQLTNIEWAQADVFHHLDALVNANSEFDLIVLDPPKFARKRSGVPDALKGYHRLHAQSMALMPAGGILVTCCCSGLITSDLLIEQLTTLANRENRQIQLLEGRAQSPDHPVSLTCLESSYLQCLVLNIGGRG